MGCYYTLYLNTYGYSLLFYKVYHEEGECRQLEFWLEKEQTLETYSALLQKSWNSTKVIFRINKNHMSVMKTSLTIIPICPRELLSHYKKLSRLVLCYKKDWATLLHFIYFHCLLLVTIYLITKLSVTYNFSACRENLTENRLSFPSAPRWVRHSYLLKELW